MTNLALLAKVAAHKKITESENYKASGILGNSHCLILKGTCEQNNQNVSLVTTYA